MRPGSPAVDAPVDGGFLIDRLGDEFQLVTIDADAPDSICVGGVCAMRLALTAMGNPELKIRWLGDAPAAVYLMRPDQHVAARWETYDESAVRAAIDRAVGRGELS
jgi:3-(3-hydroxy-phenyl)propionate hydroxylase